MTPLAIIKRLRKSRQREPRDAGGDNGSGALPSPLLLRARGFVAMRVALTGSHNVTNCAARRCSDRGTGHTPHLITAP